MSKTTGRSADSGPQQPQGSVVVLDPDRQIRALVSEWLERAGYACVQGSPTDVLPEVAADCDIVLVDVRLPRKSARQTIANIEAAAPHAAIIAMSADVLATGPSALQAVERDLEVVAVLVKPFDRNALMEALERARNVI
jgi:CheY-like chemotaxis protein